MAHHHTLYERVVCILGVATSNKPYDVAPRLGFQIYLHDEGTWYIRLMLKSLVPSIMLRMHSCVRIERPQFLQQRP